MKRKLKGNLDIKFNSLNCINILDDMSVFINGMLEAESYVLEKIFSKLKMNDMRVTYTGPYAYIDNKRIKKENASIGKLLKVKDSDGNEWYGNDIYYFLIEECFTEVEFKKVLQNQ